MDHAIGELAGSWQTLLHSEQRALCSSGRTSNRTLSVDGYLLDEQSWQILSRSSL